MTMQQATLWGSFDPVPEARPDHRICATCGKRYQRILRSEAGTRYCSIACRPSTYSGIYKPPSFTCARCEKEYTERTRSAVEQSKRVPLCQGCRDHHLAQIRGHNLDLAWAIRLIDATTCDACGDRLPRKDSGHGFKAVIDHDHQCCPGSTSCGRCVRGLLCHPCNVTAGHLENPRYASVRAYLDRTIMKE